MSSLMQDLCAALGEQVPVPAVACHCQFRCCSLVYPLFSTLCHLLRCFLRVCLYCILAGRGAERLGILARAAGPFALVHQREPFQASHRGLVWEVLHRDLKCSNLLLDVSGRATELQQDIARVTVRVRDADASERSGPRSKFLTLAAPGSHLAFEDQPQSPFPPACSLSFLFTSPAGNLRLALDCKGGPGDVFGRKSVLALRARIFNPWDVEPSTLLCRSWRMVYHNTILPYYHNTRMPYYHNTDTILILYNTMCFSSSVPGRQAPTRAAHRCSLRPECRLERDSPGVQKGHSLLRFRTAPAADGGAAIEHVGALCDTVQLWWDLALNIADPRLCSGRHLVFRLLCHRAFDGAATLGNPGQSDKQRG